MAEVNTKAVSIERLQTYNDKIKGYIKAGLGLTVIEYDPYSIPSWKIEDDEASKMTDALSMKYNNFVFTSTNTNYDSRSIAILKFNEAIHNLNIEVYNDGEGQEDNAQVYIVDELPNMAYRFSNPIFYTYKGKENITVDVPLGYYLVFLFTKDDYAIANKGVGTFTLLGTPSGETTLADSAREYVDEKIKDVGEQIKELTKETEEADSEIFYIDNLFGISSKTFGKRPEDPEAVLIKSSREDITNILEPLFKQTYYYTNYRNNNVPLLVIRFTPYDYSNDSVGDVMDWYSAIAYDVLCEDENNHDQRIMFKIKLYNRTYSITLTSTGYATLDEIIEESSNITIEWASDEDIDALFN